MNYKNIIWGVLEEGKGFLGYFYTKLLFLAVFLSILILPLEFLPNFEKFKNYFLVFEISITIFFTLEYIGRILSAPSKIKYLFSLWGIIDLISILPFFISIFHNKAFLAIKALRIFRILKILKIKAKDDLEEFIKESSEQKEYIQLLGEENVERVAIKHPVFFLKGLFLPLLLSSGSTAILLYMNFNEISIVISSVIYIMSLLLLLVNWLDYHYDVMYITNQRVLYQDKHLFGSSNNQLEYKYITNIRPSCKGLFARLFGYGDIIVDTSSDRSQVQMKHVYRYKDIVHQMNKISKLRFENNNTDYEKQTNIINQREIPRYIYPSFFHRPKIIQKNDLEKIKHSNSLFRKIKLIVRKDIKENFSDN